MRMLYPDWKYCIEAMLGEKLHWQCNELLWEMHDAAYSVEDAVAKLLEIKFPEYAVVRTGYRGTIRGIIKKCEYFSQVTGRPRQAV